VWVVLLTTLGFGVIGWVDDYRKVVHRNPKGLSARAKMGWQSIIALMVGIYLWNARHSACTDRTHRAVPEAAGFSARRILVYCAGLFRHRRHQQRGEFDRWSGWFGHHAYRNGKRRAGDIRVCGGQCGCFQKYLGIPYIPGAGELAIFCGGDCRRGACIPVVQRLPRRSFHGDVGALALGAALGTVAVIVRQELVLFIMGGVFVVEAVSVMIQVASFQAHRQTRVQDGAAASSLRIEGLERDTGRGEVLDYHDAAGAGWFSDVETEMTQLKDKSVLVLVSVRPACRWCAG